MASRVCQALLNDAKHGVLQWSGQPVQANVVGEVDLDVTESPCFPNQSVNCRDQATFLQHGWSQSLDQTSRFLNALSQQFHGFIERLPCPLALILLQFPKSLQLKQCSGRLLRESIVDLIGNQLLLPFVKVQESLRRLAPLTLVDPGASLWRFWALQCCNASAQRLNLVDQLPSGSGVPAFHRSHFMRSEQVNRCCQFLGDFQHWARLKQTAPQNSKACGKHRTAGVSPRP